jgi:hypothetical protein
VVGHTCNLSYSGGRDKEDHEFEGSLEKSVRPYLKI